MLSFFIESHDWSSEFSSFSHLLYLPHHRPAQYLTLYVLLNPQQLSGVIIQRMDGCLGDQCQHYVEVVLEGGVPTIHARLLDSELNIAAGQPISVRPSKLRIIMVKHLW